MVKSVDDIISIENEEPEEIKHCVDFLESVLDNELNQGNFKKMGSKYSVRIYWSGPSDGLGTYYNWCDNYEICHENRSRAFRFLERRYRKAGWGDAHINIECSENGSWIYSYLVLELQSEK